MHTIEIKENESGLFDVLVNGHSYKIHRNMSEDAAKVRAGDIKTEFKKLREKARIV